MNKKFLWLSLVPVVALGVGYSYFQSTRSKPVVITGLVSADDIIVNSQITARIQKLWVQEGVFVQAGQLLVTLDSSELEAQRKLGEANIATADSHVKQTEQALRYQEQSVESEIEKARAALQTAEAHVNEARANLNQKKIDRDRTVKLTSEGVFAAQERDRAEAALESAQALHAAAIARQKEAAAALENALAARKQIDIRRAEYETALQQLEAAKRTLAVVVTQLEKTKIFSPAAGLVTVRVAREGEVVTPTAPIVTLTEIDKAYVRADIEETYIDSIALGDTLSIRFPSGQTTSGRVYLKAVDMGFATQRDVSRTKRDVRTFAIKLAIDNRDHRYFPGMTAFVTLPQKH